MTCRSLERINSCYGNIRLEKRGLKASIKSIKRNNNLNLNKHHQLQAEKRHQRKPQSIYYFRMITSITPTQAVNRVGSRARRCLFFLQLEILDNYGLLSST